MRHLTFLAASALALLAVAACSPSRSAADPAGDAVTGTIAWPDGNPAAGTQVYWYLGGYSLDSADQGVASPVCADGSYSLGGCPCSPLVGSQLTSPPGVGRDIGGPGC